MSFIYMVLYRLFCKVKGCITMNTEVLHSCWFCCFELMIQQMMIKYLQQRKLHITFLALKLAVRIRSEFFRSTVCVLLCPGKSIRYENALPQTSHLKGFSHQCELFYAFSNNMILKMLSHRHHT